MTKDWLPLDPGAESLALAGPLLKSPLSAAAMKAAGIPDAPQVAIDGGIRHARNPILWAGDGDSGAAPSDIPAMLKRGQDETDLRFCLNGIRPWHWRELHLFGFTGGRKDHELANLGEIHAELKQRRGFRKAQFYGDDLAPAVLFYPAGEHIFSHQGIFSVLAFERSIIFISGKCRYPASGLTLEPLSGAGVSNDAAGDVMLRAETPLAIFFPPHG